MTNKLELSVTDKTPIEVLLQVDENGMTTAKRLYAFLELNTTNYTRWCKDNISNNEYAEKERDYWVFVSHDENSKNGGNTVFNMDVESPSKGGRPTKDYKLTATFAKKLAMASQSPKGEEARQYFIKVEEAMKQVAAVVKSDKLSNMSNITFMKAIVAELEEQKNEISILDERITKIENTKPIEVVSVVTDTKPRSTPYTRHNVYSSTTIAQAFSMGGRTLNELLATEGIIQRVPVYYSKRDKYDLCWIITDRYRNAKYSAQKYAGMKSKENSDPVEVTYAWTPKGVAFIVNLLRYKGYTQRGVINNKVKTRNREVQRNNTSLTVPKRC